MIKFNIIGDIDEQTLQDFCNMYDNLLHTETEVHVLISSWGGQVAPAAAIADMMLSSTRIRFVTIGVGAVASSASLVYIAGKPRLMYPTCIMYEHAFHVTEEGGYVREMSNRVNMLRKWEAVLKARFKARTNLPDYIFDMMFSVEGWDCDSRTAVEFGICHEIIEQAAYR